MSITGYWLIYLLLRATFTPNATKIPPNTLLKTPWKRLYRETTFLFVKKNATRLNRSIVLMIIITPRRIIKLIDVSGEITNVNKLKKNIVALGFNTLVKNPFHTACIGLIAGFNSSATTSILDDFASIELTPI